MTESKPRAKSAKSVKVGDLVELDKGAPGLVVLPDGSVVTCRTGYTVRHEGRHVIGGVEYTATDPRKPKAD